MNKLCIVFFTLTSSMFFQKCCSNPIIVSSRESQAIKIVQEIIKTEQPLKAEPLLGGYSDASLMKVTEGENAYVVRFLGTEFSAQWHQNEITCQQVASDSGYGPHIYCADVQRGIIVMEYLAPEVFPSDKNRLSAYVDLVKKIHSGNAYPVTYSLIGFTQNCLQGLIPLQQTYIDMPKVKTILDAIGNAVACFPHSAPCHRDLHLGNVIYSRGKFFAIDYTLAGQDDPYIDLASNLFYDFPAGNQKVLLTEYLGRQPTEKELAKLSLMKSVVLMYCGVALVKYLLPEGFLEKIPAQEISPRPYVEMLQQIAEHTIDLTEPCQVLELALAAFAEVFKHYDSEQFNKEIKLLQETL